MTNLLQESKVKNQLRSLLPKYLEHLKKQDEPEYTGSFFIFEDGEQLMAALLASDYARKHLDYDFFHTALYILVHQKEIHDIDLLYRELVKIIEESMNSRDWVVVHPLRFNPMNWMFRKKIWTGSKKFGRFILLPTCSSAKNLQTQLKKHYGVDSVSSQDFAHQSRDNISGGALEKLPTLTFETHGSDAARNISSEAKRRYFVNVLELYGVLSGCHSSAWPSGTASVNHAFFINVQTGEIDRTPLNMETKIYAKAESALFSYMRRHGFEEFSNHIFFSNDKVFARIKSALYFFHKGMHAKDKVLEFICYVIALESLFSKDKSTPIRITLAEFTALLCYPKSKRLEMHDKIKEIYDHRSKLVHMGRFNLEYEMINDSQVIAATAILHYFKLYKRILDKKLPGELENHLFAHLRDLRLGIA
ncbi:hypothetical protein [Pseudomonas koreensis]|uniref:hypothetical protein n=1 Tax=Pseudomonas koreensis TaxID=198620 RepID=UPI00381E2178